jgi:hypothetical protein
LGKSVFIQEDQQKIPMEGRHNKGRNLKDSCKDSASGVQCKPNSGMPLTIADVKSAEETKISEEGLKNKVHYEIPLVLMKHLKLELYLSIFMTELSRFFDNLFFQRSQTKGNLSYSTIFSDGHFTKSTISGTDQDILQKNPAKRVTNTLGAPLSKANGSQCMETAFSLIFQQLKSSLSSLLSNEIPTKDIFTHEPKITSENRNLRNPKVTQTKRSCVWKQLHASEFNECKPKALVAHARKNKAVKQVISQCFLKQAAAYKLLNKAKDPMDQNQNLNNFGDLFMVGDVEDIVLNVENGFGEEALRLQPRDEYDLEFMRGEEDDDDMLAEDELEFQSSEDEETDSFHGSYGSPPLLGRSPLPRRSPSPTKLSFFMENSCEYSLLLCSNLFLARSKNGLCDHFALRSILAITFEPFKPHA